MIIGMTYVPTRGNCIGLIAYFGNQRWKVRPLKGLGESRCFDDYHEAYCWLKSLTKGRGGVSE